MKGSAKAVIVLIVIALCSALLLSILNEVLYVSEEEKDNMKLKKVHDSEVVKRITDLSGYGFDSSVTQHADFGSVSGVYCCEDGVVIVKAKGIGGYSSGWVETYVAISSDGKILNVVVADNKNQSFISTIKQSWLDEQFKGKSVDGSFTINKDITPASGASRSSNATVNSVNMAMFFYNSLPEDFFIQNNNNESKEVSGNHVTSGIVCLNNELLGKALNGLQSAIKEVG